jgi:hypothetical protein
MATKSPSDLPSLGHNGALPPAFIAQERPAIAADTSSSEYPPSQVRHSEEWKEHQQVGGGQAGSRSETV